MFECALCIHYMVIAAIIVIPSLSVSIGDGLIGLTLLKSIDKQAYAYNDIMRMGFISSALVETTAILSLFFALMLVLSMPNEYAFYPILAEIGIALALCLPGAIIGITSAFPAQEACNAIARQPLFAQKIVGFGIMTQALVQTPIIVSFVIAFLIKNQAVYSLCLADSLRLIASGLCIGLGGVGPALGLAYFAKRACWAIGVNREAYGSLVSFTLISQALIETPVIFALLISLLILFTIPTLGSCDLLRGIAMIAAALSTGFGTLGAGISSGKTAAAACEQIAYNPNEQATISQASMFGQAFIETCILYAVLISLILIFIR